MQEEKWQRQERNLSELGRATEERGCRSKAGMDWSWRERSGAMADYGKFMGGVDRAIQLQSYYERDRRYKKC